MSITTGMIKELRDATSLGIADCKKALEQTGGDFDAAIKILREKGLLWQPNAQVKKPMKAKLML